MIPKADRPETCQLSLISADTRPSEVVLHGRAVFVIAIPVVGEVPGGIVPVGIGLHLLQMPDQVPVVLALEVEYIASVSL